MGDGLNLGPFSATMTFGYWGEDLEWHFELWVHSKLVLFRNGCEVSGTIGALRTRLKAEIEDFLLTPMMRLQLELTR